MGDGQESVDDVNDTIVKGDGVVDLGGVLQQSREESSSVAGSHSFHSLTTGHVGVLRWLQRSRDEHGAVDARIGAVENVVAVIC